MSCANCATGSVTRWRDYLLNIWPFTTMTICPVAFKHLCSIFCQKQNKPSANLPKSFNKFQLWGNFAKSGHSVNRRTNYLRDNFLLQTQGLDLGRLREEDLLLPQQQRLGHDRTSANDHAAAGPGQTLEIRSPANRQANGRRLRR